MENTGQKRKIAIYSLSVLAAVLLAGGAYLREENSELIRQNDLAEQRADSLLSVKFQLEGDVRSLSRQLETTADEKTYLNSRVDNLHTQLTDREQTVARLRQMNFGRSRAIRGLSRHVNTLTTRQDSLENQMRAVQQKIAWLTDSNTRLTRQNADLRPLKQEVADLEVELRTKVPRTALTGDAFRIETVRRNDKETAKAKKVNALVVSLSVPAEMGLTGTQDVYLSLTDEQQNGIVPGRSTHPITLPGKSEVIPVHAVQAVNFSQNPQRISFTFNPEETISPGIYRASVYTKDAYLGTAEFRLRDSFWFF